MRISLEDGRRMDAGMADAPAAFAGTMHGAAVPETVTPAEVLRRARLQTMIAAALDGTIGADTPLRPFDVAKLGPQHIGMILDRIAGYSNLEIAERQGCTPSHISHILTHPYAQTLMGELMSATADRMSDPIDRIQKFTHEMINIKLELVRDPGVKAAVRDKIASDFLDRAGYGARQKVEVENTHTVKMPASIAVRLADALDEANRVADIDYSGYTGRKVSSLVRLPEGKAPGEVLDPSSGSGQSAADVEASLDYPSVTPQEAELALAKAEEREYLKSLRRTA